MDRQGALELCKELRQLAGGSPGANAAAVRRARDIGFAFGVDERSNSYVREKVAAALAAARAEDARRLSA